MTLKERWPLTAEREKISIGLTICVWGPVLAAVLVIVSMVDFRNKQMAAGYTWEEIRAQLVKLAAYYYPSITWTNERGHTWLLLPVVFVDCGKSDVVTFTSDLLADIRGDENPAAVKARLSANSARFLGVFWRRASPSGKGACSES